MPQQYLLTSTIIHIKTLSLQTKIKGLKLYFEVPI
jgi:hypothetical protein